MKQSFLFMVIVLFVLPNFTFGQSKSKDLNAFIITPPTPETPRINGAKVFGVRPGSPFLFTIPATGIRPMEFLAVGLPKGLHLDSKTGVITGRMDKKGTYNVILKAKNTKGVAERKLKIVVGETIALTPPMGWNSWNCFASNVSAEKIKKMADAMVDLGLINHGWSYINIDDFWENNNENTDDSTLRGDFRDAQGNILPNVRFPDMKGLANYIHGKGLKAGLYSSPGPLTCGKCAGSWQQEMQDAKTFADWGFDYLKYDWCSYDRIISDSTKGVPSLHHKGNDSIAIAYPYDVMGKALKAQKRDIVYSLSAGRENIWKWAAKVNANCWRITGDMGDSWQPYKGAKKSHDLSRIFSLDRTAPYTVPGHYNDPDMLVIGYLGWGKELRPSHLTPDEQYSHISLWCLLSAPLLLGCDLEKLDSFTLNLITNDEVIDIDQDPLAMSARQVATDDSLVVYKKTLADGSIAVGLFNRRPTRATITAKWNDLGIKGKQTVRDVWRQKDIAIDKDSYQAEVAPHGVVLLKMSPVK